MLLLNRFYSKKRLQILYTEFRFYLHRRNEIYLCGGMINSAGIVLGGIREDNSSIYHLEKCFGFCISPFFCLDGQFFIACFYNVCENVSVAGKTVAPSKGTRRLPLKNYFQRFFNVFFC